jgi:hypothetical protein
MSTSRASTPKPEDSGSNRGIVLLLEASPRSCHSVSIIRDKIDHGQPGGACTGRLAKDNSHAQHRARQAKRAPL